MVESEGAVPALRDLLTLISKEFRLADVPDSTGAANGLQILTPQGLEQPVKLVATSTDASLDVIETAIEMGAALLISHHGLCWTLRGLPLPTVTAEEGHNISHPEAERVSAALTGGLNVVGLHLPLDAHPRLGNNIRLALELGLEPLDWFRATAGRAQPQIELGAAELIAQPSSLSAGPSVEITPVPLAAPDASATAAAGESEWPPIEWDDSGVRGTICIALRCRVPAVAAGRQPTRRELHERLEMILATDQVSWSHCQLFPGDDEVADNMAVRTVAICTGAAGGEVLTAAAEGCDLLISGEAPAHAALHAAESNCGLLLGGHHATETVGPRAVAEWLNSSAEQLGWNLKTRFISAPTGL
jgi:putative NIF3 family GTP cyclohydrolase 1 type 2